MFSTTCVDIYYFFSTFPIREVYEFRKNIKEGPSAVLLSPVLIGDLDKRKKKKRRKAKRRRKKRRKEKKKNCKELSISTNIF